MRILMKHSVFKFVKFDYNKSRRCLTQSCTDVNTIELNNSVKRSIENYWKDNVNKGEFDVNNVDNKYYVLSMFPYPSGNLHMGHVRVYTISDAMARFHRLNGKNVFHPIGWDAFGLPAENAAIQRNIDPQNWTQHNINQMKEQLMDLGCSFDWSHELSTCNPDYYKWTQKLFLMLYNEGLAYQNEAIVNWDPVDKTVLADEQVDANGCSWRSGAKVQKKLLKQWFIRTTKFAESLLNGLNDPLLQDWRDIKNLQTHWIGNCNGYSFQLKTITKPENNSATIRIWTESPTYLIDPNAFITLKSTHHLRKTFETIEIFNPFTNKNIPVVFTDDLEYPNACDSYLASPHFAESDKNLMETLGLPFDANICINAELNKEQIIKIAQEMRIGGYKVSSKLKDWLISRQRYWGTPIPIVHCESCGSVPVNEKDLPIQLPSKYSSAAEKEKFIKTECPKCGNSNARREMDTMDTFVDSSWYFLRFPDAKNSEKIFNDNFVKKCMPVDLYIGGKEHAVLHLYYARFMNHFINSLDLVSYPEPFKRLLVQGMVMGRSYRVKGSGKYLKEDEVEILNAKKNKAIVKATKENVIMSWEKMSKSKLNGVDPADMISEYGCDTTRLIILGDVAPTSHRNWSTATFPGILNWQKRVWLSINDFYTIRSNTNLDSIDSENEEFVEEDGKLFDSRNYYLKGVTFNYRHTHQLSVGISKMQGLTNSIRRTPRNVIKFGEQFERALGCQIVMLAPMAPHFASELWSKFTSTPNRISQTDEFLWDQDVLKQRWPDVDMEYKLDLTIKVNGFESAVIKIPRRQLDKFTQNEAMDIAFNTDSVTSYLIDKKIRLTNFTLYPGIEGVLNIYVDKAAKPNEKILQKEIQN